VTAPSDTAKRALVLGAGPAGLSAAYHLLDQGYDVTVVDRDVRVGGLGGSFKWDDFILDYGPHAFHVKPSPSMDLVTKLFADRADDLIYQSRDELLYLRGRFFRYPVKVYELLRKLNPLFSARLVFDFGMSALIYRYIAVPDDTFESWCIKRFGKSLYELIFGNYTAKVWGIHPSRIAAKFAARKIHKLNLRDIILKLLGGKGEEQETYWKGLCYPRHGSGELFERLGDEIRSRGGRFRLETTPERLVMHDGRVSAVTVQGPHGAETLPCDLVLSSIPLQSLVPSLQPPLGEFATYATKLLKYRSLLLIFVAFDQPKVIPAHWIYLVDQSFKFNRLTEQKNMSPATAPAGRSVVACERGCYYNDALWRTSDEELFRGAKEELARVPGVDVSRISGYQITRLKDAYPVYDLDFDKNLRVVLDALGGIPNLYSIGRQGLFLQNDMHDSMEMGRMGAEYAAHAAPSAHWYDYMLDFWKLSDRQPLL
jgi:protoporphyrinogen oxidase